MSKKDMSWKKSNEGIRVPEKVDLFTHSRELEDLILSEYPGTIFENQHYIDDSKKEKTYCFYDLDYAVLRDFLSSLEEKYSFELRDRKGKVVGLV